MAISDSTQTITDFLLKTVMAALLALIAFLWTQASSRLDGIDARLRSVEVSQERVLTILTAAPPQRSNVAGAYSLENTFPHTNHPPLQ